MRTKKNNKNIEEQFLSTLQFHKKSGKTKKNKNFCSTFSKSGKSGKSGGEIPLVEYNNFENNNSKLTSSQLIKSNEVTKHQFVKTLLTPYQNIKFLPENNFYRYINNIWLEKTNLSKNQKYITEIDNYRLVQDNVYKQLNSIILDYIKNNNNYLSKQMHNFYLSAINFNPISSSKKISKVVLETIDNLRQDKNNLWKMMGLVNQNHIVNSFGIFKWSLEPDKKEPGIFRVYLKTHQFPLLDVSILYGNKNDPVIKNQIKHKNIFLKNIFKNILGPNNNINYEDILKVEKKLLDAKNCNEVEEGNDYYNRVYRKDALEKYGFDWDEYSKVIGFKKPPDFFIIENLNYLKCIIRVLKEEWNSEEWRPFWLLIHYRVITRFTKKWRDVFFNYYGKFQKGLQGFWYNNDAVKSAILLSYPFGHFLSKEYRLRYTNQENIDFIKKLGEDLKTVFIRILKRNNWLSPKTKNYAIHKINKLQFYIGEKESHIEVSHFKDAVLDYKPDEFFNNITKVTLFRNKEFINLEGKPSFEIIHLDWSKYPVEISGPCSYVVNAFYYPIKNSIFIPLGYIQSPFVDLNEKGFEYNLANVGFTIAHELSHALDNIGGRYDANGVLKNWWTESDKKKYQALQDDVLEQYNEFAKRDGIKYNSELSLSEDLADISGLAICEEYLRDYMEVNEFIAPVKYLRFREFYHYFAYQMRQKIPKSALETQLLTNPHPPDVFRTNVPLSRSEIFRASYNVKKGDGMWWHNTNTIW
jgi:predicted metalloendopeptidase